MSHTGSVIRPSKSPGVIQIESVGFAQKGNELVIVTPKDSDEEKFVIFPESAFPRNKSGRVKFNLKQYIESEWINKPNPRDRITKVDIDELRKEKPELRNVAFKFVATEVSELGPESIWDHLHQNPGKLRVKFLGSTDEIDAVRKVNSVDFDKSPDNRNNKYDKRIYQNEDAVWQEIMNNGEHSISPDSEVPFVQ